MNSQPDDKTTIKEVNRYFPFHDDRHTEILYMIIQNYKKISQDEIEIRKHFEYMMDIMNVPFYDRKYDYELDEIEYFLDILKDKNEVDIKKNFNLDDLMFKPSSLNIVLEPFIIDNYGQFLLIESIKDGINGSCDEFQAYHFIKYLNERKKLREIVNKLTDSADILIYNKYFEEMNMGSSIKSTDAPQTDGKTTRFKVNIRKKRGKYSLKKSSIKKYRKSFRKKSQKKRKSSRK
jgi:hypothetical protein